MCPFHISIEKYNIMFIINKKNSNKIKGNRKYNKTTEKSFHFKIVFNMKVMQKNKIDFKLEIFRLKTTT